MDSSQTRSSRRFMMLTIFAWRFAMVNILRMSESRLALLSLFGKMLKLRPTRHWLQIDHLPLCDSGMIPVYIAFILWWICSLLVLMPAVIQMQRWLHTKKNLMPWMWLCRWQPTYNLSFIRKSNGIVHIQRVMSWWESCVMSGMLGNWIWMLISTMMT